MPRPTKPLRVRTRIRPVSAKRAKEQRERRIAMENAFGLSPACSAQLDGCDGYACDAHELLSRARGGSITDPENVRPLCRPCHTYITEHPAWAEANGWALPSWGGDAA